MTYPLAIYTADHGLAWSYPEAEISYGELDACRKAFGQLPDFDSGAPGIEGVWVTQKYIFIMRCQRAKAWDFRGRDATYLAVTWVKREDYALVDIEQLLASRALSEPQKEPPRFFNLEMRPPRRMMPAYSQGSAFVLSDGFMRVPSFIAELPQAAQLKAVRKIGEVAVSCSIEHARPKEASPLKQPQHRLPEYAPPQPLHNPKLSWVHIAIFAIGIAVTFILGCLFGIRLEDKFNLIQEETPPSPAEVVPKDEASADSSVVKPTTPNANKVDKTPEASKKSPTMHCPKVWFKHRLRKHEENTYDYHVWRFYFCVPYVNPAEPNQKTEVPHE